MSLTVADLPGILGDLARLEPERFRALEADGVYEFLLDGLPWHVRASSIAVSTLALVQAAVQEAIVARGWDYGLGNGRSLIAISGDGPFAYVAPHGGHVPWAYADLPAIALASAYRDALLAQQEVARE